MYTTNALKLRQNLGAILKRVKNGEPVLVEQRRQPTAVLIHIDEYRKRFADIEADQKREELVKKIKNARIKLPAGKTSLELIQELRK